MLNNNDNNSYNMKKFIILDRLQCINKSATLRPCLWRAFQSPRLTWLARQVENPNQPDFCRGQGELAGCFLKEYLKLFWME